MRFHTLKESFDYSFEQVSTGFWRRYPNSYSNHVLSEDVVNRFVQNGTLVTKRLLTKTNRMPGWGERFIGQSVNNKVGIIEESVLDPVKKTFTTYTRNIGLQNILSIEEKCVYRCHPTDETKTEVEKFVWISSGMTGISRAVTKFGLERFKSNASKASQGFLQVLETLYGQSGEKTKHALGVTSTHHFTDKIKEKAKIAKQMAQQKASDALPVVAAATTGQSSSSSS